jgi:hypothetical protein
MTQRERFPNWEMTPLGWHVDLKSASSILASVAKSVFIILRFFVVNLPQGAIYGECDKAENSGGYFS